MLTRKLALSAVVVMLGAAACGSDDPPPRKTARSCKWVIGTLGALSGDYASIGRPIFQGIEYAIDEHNLGSDLPCDVELRAEDSQGDSNQAAVLARALVEDDRLVAVVGPYFSGETLATGRIFSQADIVFITPSATGATIDDQAFTTFFRAVADDAIQGEVAARYIASLGPNKVAVVHDNQDYSKGLAEAVQEGLGDVATGPYVIDPGETDYSAVVAEVAQANPQVIFYGGYSTQAAPLLRQLRDAGVKAPFISDDGAKDPSFGELAGEEAAEGAQVTCPCADPAQIPAASSFVEGIQATYDRPPGTFAADAYDATRLIIEALKGVDKEAAIEDVRRRVLRFLSQVDGYEGVTKTYSFDRDGQVEIGPEGIWIYEWSQKHGDFRALGPASDLIDG
ncbi:MAG TPA: branched-chain amino acid ABC transporter substrate-binding protein [Actinomycetota bacterium]|nr:branched-chain amino acid ABC transporter substrate-binding protein [Actinomycetota bacterium]